MLLQTPFNRHFPFGLSLEPIQARSAVIITRCAPLRLARGQFFEFSCLRPHFLGSYHLNTRLSNSMAGLRARCAQTFPPEASDFLSRRDSYASIRLATTGGGSASRSMRSRIAANNLRVTATLASWNVTCFECRVTFTPILTSLSRSVVSD